MNCKIKNKKTKKFERNLEIILLTKIVKNKFLIIIFKTIL